MVYNLNCLLGYKCLAWLASGTKRDGLSEADLDAPAKLPEQRLERGEEAEAFPGRQIVGEDDLLQLGVTERVEVEVASGHRTAYLAAELSTRSGPYAAQQGSSPQEQPYVTPLRLR